MNFEEEKVKADITKVHSEINMLVNMRILIAIGGLSAILISINSWRDFLIPRTWAQSVKLSIAISSGWFIVLALQYASLNVWRKIRIYAAYLSFNNYSKWENDWRLFRFNQVDIPELKKFQQSILKADTSGFYSIFSAALILMIIQLAFVFILCVYLYFWGIETDEDYLYCIPLVVICFILCIGSLILMRKFSKINKDFENKAKCLWCVALGEYKKQICGGTEKICK